MKFKKVLRIAAFVMAVGGFAGVAHAESIGPNCGSCFGGIWTLEYSQISATEVLITYIADLSHPSAGITDIDAIAFKIVSGGTNDHLTSATLQSGPVGWGTDAELSKNLNNNGCATPGDDFVCSAGLVTALVPGVYTWVFDVHYVGSLLLGSNQASIKADLSGTNCTNGCLLSENITLSVPDGGSTVTLLGSVLLGLSMLRRRFSRS